MTMNRLDDLVAFLAIVERGSQTAAARHLQRTLQSIGRSLTSLEKGMGVALVKRTTRQSHPTEAGLAFYARVKPALAEIDNARSEAADLARKLSGRLRIGAPVLFARAFVAPAICDFLARFPQVEVELKASDRSVDLMSEELDVAVRIRNLPDSSLRVRRLGELRAAVVASKSYLQRNGCPQHPDELAQHTCIVRTVDGRDEPWPFVVGGERQAFRVRGRLRTNDTPAMLEAVTCGLGIGFAPLWQVREAVERGSVDVILQEFETERVPIYAVLPPTRTQTAKVRRFVDLLSLRMSESRL
jgi:DNA-binding transcriptional LysR family regulator